ncbi:MULTISPECIES: AI-2E family transporter [Leuconostoc]|uniref:Pheromone autoinducer 2 transporter n=1 Tax=Leuconostoc suionicum TaxID=1511761 RepID=A0A2N9K9G8_9LACO|nr:MULTISPECIES: AI-2E family transporter [Leuconostoc]API71727.1 AI-2E family transporter [Leuconostoc suionicum]MBE4727096.1 AI-2E family transporter [Leuconostoc suionicum]MBS1007713.1 AI-2E family transporter [Leuconostoc suionicum]MCT4376363.1 AI-2E family transporter [Leuconostoc suionicum]MCT4402476.1 AI-2E family transporter [Leuconostoc suionicum]
MKKPEQQSWYSRWFSGNDLLNGLIVILLVLLIIFLAWQVRFLFEPIRALFTAVGAPIMISGVLYYLLSPIVGLLEKYVHLPRNLSIGVVLIVLLAIIGVAVATIVMVLRNQVIQFIDNWPDYWKTSEAFINETFASEQFKFIRDYLNHTNSDLNQNVLDWSKKYLTSGVAGISSFASILTSIGVTIVSTPFILYYMLLDGHKFSSFVSSKFPNNSQLSVRYLLTEISKQIAQYIRGQLGVALAVMIMFSIGYTIIGLPYGILLALMAGFFNLIPYVGSIIAQVPVFTVALIAGGPKMLILAIIVLAFEQPIEAHVISPKILGEALSIHPVTVIVVLLSSGHIFGVLGVVLAVPSYAVAKVFVTHIYDWWRANSDLFEVEEVAEK